MAFWQGVVDVLVTVHSLHVRDSSRKRRCSAHDNRGVHQEQEVEQRAQRGLEGIVAERGMGVTGIKTHVHVTHSYIVVSSFQGAVLCHGFAARDKCQHFRKPQIKTSEGEEKTRTPVRAQVWTNRCQDGYTAFVRLPHVRTPTEKR